MLQALRRRLDREEEGFTLIELMVVVLIIAILLAIAIPTFLSARERAQDRAAQSNLRNTLTAAKAIFTDKQTYADANATALKASEPSLNFTSTGDSTGPRDIKVTNSGATTFVAVAESDSGKCFAIADIAASTNGGTWYREVSGTGTTCGTTSAGTPPTSWNQNGF